MRIDVHTSSDGMGMGRLLAGSGGKFVAMGVICDTAVLSEDQMPAIVMRVATVVIFM